MQGDDNTAFGKFGIAYKHLQDLADNCKGRKFAEQVEYYEKQGGDAWLQRGLCTDLKKGLKGDEADMQERRKAYGDNHEHVRPPQGFCTLFKEALDDYTLRILLVASVQAVIINMIFQPPEQRSTAWIDGFSIFVAVMVCAGVTSVNDYQKEQQFQELNQVAGDRKKVNIIRNGKLEILHQSMVMVGDLVQLEEGMEIPADGVVIEAAELTTDEAAMTGEPDPIQKNTLAQCLAKQQFIQDQGERNDAKSHDVPSCVILSGTRILTGDGKMIVITTGNKSVIGKIKAILKQQDQEETPLQQKLEALARDIGNFGLISAIIIVTVLLIRFTIERVSEDAWDHSKHWSELINFAIIGITVVVVAIPEGLPLAVTLSLAYSVKKMLKDQNLVRKMQACETMGGADCICSDKTGTLTTNKMTLTHWWTENLNEIPYNNASIDIKTLIPDKFYDLWIASLACNGAAILRPEPKGSRTQIALLQFLQKCGINYQKQRERFDVEKAAVKFPFSSARKRMGMVLKFQGKDRLFQKGGSDKITAACSHFYEKSTGKVVPIDAQLRETIDAAIQTMADKALRTIGLAYKDINLASDDLTTQDDKTGVFQIETSELVLVGILGIADVLRSEVPGAIAQCKQAGIKVRMVTGDNQDTARAIARDCGIVESSEDMVLQGDQFIEMTGGIECRNCQLNLDCKCPLDSHALQKLQKQCEAAALSVKKMSDSELKEHQRLSDQLKQYNQSIRKGVVSFDITPLSGADQKKALLYDLSQKKSADLKIREDTLKNMDKFKTFYKKLAVMARSQPEHKYALVTGLQELGHVVAVTGDGTNDAPALKKADVGFAMGIAGTEVARQAAAIILLDDNFQSIVSACMWGRNIYDSIKQFLQFQLTVNVVAVFITLIGAASLKQDILRPIQMLWVNLIMDTFASLALATEPPTESLLDRMPQKRDEYIISKKMFKHIFGQAFLQLSILMIFLFGGPSFLPEYEDDFDQFLVREWLKDKKQFPKDEWWMGKYSDSSLNYVRAGNFRQVDGLTDQYEKLFREYFVPPRHFTYIFAVFVFLQIFNFLNNRKLKDEINIFQGIQRNMLFPIIVGLICVMQIIIVTFGGIAFHCYTYFGLEVKQWLIVIGFGSLSLIMSFILKLIPQDKCIQAGNKQADPQKERSLSLRLKRQSSKGHNNHPVNLQNTLINYQPSNQ